jgi:lysophospholipase L1-like esterase
VLIDLLPDFAPWQGREGEIALKGRAGSTHPNARGYALIGRAVARELEARGLLP